MSAWTTAVSRTRAALSIPSGEQPAGSRARRETRSLCIHDPKRRPGDRINPARPGARRTAPRSGSEVEDAADAQGRCLEVRALAELVLLVAELAEHIEARRQVIDQRTDHVMAGLQVVAVGEGRVQ